MRLFTFSSVEAMLNSYQIGQLKPGEEAVRVHLGNVPADAVSVQQQLEKRYGGKWQVDKVGDPGWRGGTGYVISRLQ